MLNQHNPLSIPQVSRYTGARTRIHSAGYVQEHCPDHPAANRFGMVMQHRLVMEEKLGRLLGGREVVHHEGSDKTNNRIEGLLLFPDQSTHMMYHRQISGNWGKGKRRTVPAVIDMVRKAAADPKRSVASLNMSPVTVRRICRENDIHWQKANPNL